MPKLSKWMEENIPESLTVFSFPCEHGRRIRTSNIVERLNREIHRRIRTIGIFPHEASRERLLTAIVMEISEEWQVGKVYLELQRQAEEDSP